MSSRIVERGSNHQSLRAGELHESVIWQFLGQHEKFDQVGNELVDGKFDYHFEVKPEWDRLQALKFVVDQLKGIDGLGIEEGEMIGEDKLKEAVESAKTYKVEIKKSIPEDSTTAIKKRQQQQQAGSVKPRYYGLLVDVNLKELVENHLPLEMKQDETSIWNQLKKASRVELKPHVTLVHQFELQSSQDPVFQQEKQSLWNRYENLVEKAEKENRTEESLTVEISLGPRLVWNDRVISIEVSALYQRDDAVQEDSEKISLVSDRSAHITVGTRSSDIRPVEGKFLMERALKGGTGGEVDGEEDQVREIRIGETKVKARLAGLS